MFSDLFPRGKFRTENNWGRSNFVGYFAEETVENWLRKRGYDYVHPFVLDSSDRDAEYYDGETKRKAEAFMGKELGNYRELWSVVKKAHPFPCLNWPERHPSNTRFCRVDLIARMPSPTLVEVKGNGARFSPRQKMFLTLAKDYGLGAMIARVQAVTGRKGNVIWEDWEAGNGKSQI